MELYVEVFFIFFKGFFNLLFLCKMGLFGDVERIFLLVLVVGLIKINFGFLCFWVIVNLFEGSIGVFL